MLDGVRRVAVVSQAAVAERYAAVARDSLDAESELFPHGRRRGREDAGDRRGPVPALRDVGPAARRRGDRAGWRGRRRHRRVRRRDLPPRDRGACRRPPRCSRWSTRRSAARPRVNLPEGKNLVGAFHQPVGVLADTDTLGTLPDARVPVRAGRGREVRADGRRRRGPVGLVDSCARRPPRCWRATRGCSPTSSRAACAIKADVVARDPDERTGMRATLNYGHTLAHALETAGGYGLTHGEAVAVGLVFAGALAGGCERVGAGRRRPATRRSSPRSGLPTGCPAADVDPDELLALMRRRQEGERRAHVRAPGPAAARAGRRPARRPRSRHAFASSASTPRSELSAWPRSCCSPGPT